MRGNMQRHHFGSRQKSFMKAQFFQLHGYRLYLAISALSENLKPKVFIDVAMRQRMCLPILAPGLDGESEGNGCGVIRPRQLRVFLHQT